MFGSKDGSKDEHTHDSMKMWFNYLKKVDMAEYIYVYMY